MDVVAGDRPAVEERDVEDEVSGGRSVESKMFAAFRHGGGNGGADLAVIGSSVASSGLFSGASGCDHLLRLFAALFAAILARCVSDGAFRFNTLGTTAGKASKSSSDSSKPAISGERSATSFKR